MSSLEYFSDEYNCEILIDDECDEESLLDIFNGNLLKYLDVPIYWRYIGLYYEKDQEDYVKAVKYYNMSINSLKNAQAMNSLGAYYMYGVGNDLKMAIRMFKMAMDHGDSSALTNIGVYYDNLGQIDEAIKYHKMAADHGDHYSMYNLAMIYRDDKKDTESFLKYIKMGIENGSIMAINTMGVYHDQNGNITEAIKYYKMAIDKGHSFAMSNLGIIYYDQEKYYDSIKYLHMALENGNDMAHDALEDMFCGEHQTPEIAILLCKYDMHEYCNIFTSDMMHVDGLELSISI